MRVVACCALAALAATSSLRAQILPPDPVFADAFEQGARSLAPNPAYIAQGASGDTLPTPLVLTLSSPVAVDTFVPIVSSEPARLGVVGGGVTVQAGQDSATVQVSGITGGAMPVTLTATLGNSVGAGVRVEGALNEAGSAAGEAEFCNLQFPVTFSVDRGQPGPSVYGRLHDSGVTETPGAPAGWLAALGHGPIGTDPRLLAGWHFIDASWNAQVGNDDEFAATPIAPWTVGAYAYAFRFSQNGGVAWTYCDTDGAGSNVGLAFDAGALGTMTVARSLVINEVDYDNPGAIDTAEFVEILNVGTGPANLAGVALVLVNGNSDNEYRRVDLGAAGTLVPGAYLVVQDGSLTLPAGTQTLGFANCTEACIMNGAPGGVALVDTSHQVLIDTLSYEGAINAAVIGGFPSSVNLVEGTALSSTIADSNTAAASLARSPNGSDTDDAATDWALSTTPTPGAANQP